MVLFFLQLIDFKKTHQKAISELQNFTRKINFFGFDVKIILSLLKNI